MLASARRRAWRPAGVCRSVPIYGRNVGRAISPAAGPCGIAGVAGRCKHRPLRSTGQGPAALCRTFLPPGGNAPLRLRLAAHPPSGLRCPHRTARAEARLCSATVKPAPFRFLRRRRRSTSQPLAGEALGGLPPGRLPCKGSCRRQPTEGCGALPCQYPSGLPQTSPAGVNARPTMQGKRAAGPGTAGGVPVSGSFPRWPATPPLRRGRCLHRPAGGPGGRLTFAGQCPFTAAM